MSVELFSRTAKEAQTVTISAGTTCDNVIFYFKNSKYRTFGCDGDSFAMSETVSLSNSAKITTTDVKVEIFKVKFPVSEHDMDGAGSSAIIAYPKALSYTLTLVPKDTNKLIENLVFRGFVSMRSAI